ADHAPAEIAEVVPDRTTRTDDAAGVTVAHEVMEAEDAAYLAEAPAPAAAKAESIAMDEVVIEGQGVRGRAVGAKELARNQSMADAEMTSGMNSRTEAEKAGDRRAMAHGRRLGDDAALMELLAAGW
ncbi:MAG: hypothetical protein RBT71_12525, partial [Flavobacteriales bacterium]|nr:hypothetical protein [Flavobacteriales bacterium]